MIDPNQAFELRVLDYNRRAIQIRAFDDYGLGPDRKQRLRIEVRHEGRMIFDRSQLWVGLPYNWSTDGNEAREAVLGCVALQPGDTDRDYFKDYSPEQLEWVRSHGDLLGSERRFRYCDENGNPKVRR